METKPKWLIWWCNRNVGMEYYAKPSGLRHFMYCYSASPVVRYSGITGSIVPSILRPSLHKALGDQLWFYGWFQSLSSTLTPFMSRMTINILSIEILYTPTGRYPSFLSHLNLSSVLCTSLSSLSITNHSPDLVSWKFWTGIIGKVPLCARKRSGGAFNGSNCGV